MLVEEGQDESVEVRGTTLSHSTVLLLVPPKAVSKVTQDVYKRVLDQLAENAMERMSWR